VPVTALVTVAVPVYKRLQYLAGALRAVASQDYPNIELIVSDNGVNGTVVERIVAEHYPRPYRYRQNPATVALPEHWNQLVAEASGEYLVILADDDELSPNYVSELTRLLDRHPAAAVAIAAQEILDESGKVVRRSRGPLPELLSGRDFIRAAFHTYEYGFECFMTIFARTAELRRCGGYPDFVQGQHGDDTLLLKLCLGRPVALSERCAFRYRVYESSYGLAQRIEVLAMSTNQFLRFLDSDPHFREFARSHPEEWTELRGYIEENKLLTYYFRWRHMYRRRLTRLQWIRAAFAFPYSPLCYRWVIATVLTTAAHAVTERAKRVFPGTHRLYRKLRYGRR
jgi:glycosyltransferase involved in cell wall biosynthesis